MIRIGPPARPNRFGFEYFNGPREQGYRDYRYDNRRVGVAHGIIAHFALRLGDCVLDIGCAEAGYAGDYYGTILGAETSDGGRL